MWTSGQCARIFALNGAILVMLLARTFNTEPSCDELLKPLDPTTLEPMVGRPQTINPAELETKLYSEKWILKDAYSTDPIDKFALRHAKSSWAEFSKDHKGMNATMGHMIAWPGPRECCVYHHFHDMVLGDNNTVILELDEYNSSAQIRFLKNCDECLTLTVNAHVPDYARLTYLLVYGLKGKLDEIDEQRVRQQAACLKLRPQAPFYYSGTGHFCPENSSPYDASFPSAHLLSRWYGIEIPEHGHGK